MPKLIKYYKIKYNGLEKILRFLKELTDYVDEAKIFFAGMEEFYLIVKGDYETSPYPTETTDFQDIIAKQYNFTYTNLSAKPYPEKRWSGKWISINEKIGILEKLMKKDTQPIADIMDNSIKKLKAILAKDDSQIILEPIILEMKSVLTEIHSELTDKEKQKNGLDNAEFSWKLAIENLGIIKTNNIDPVFNDILKTHGLE